MDRLWRTLWRELEEIAEAVKQEIDVTYSEERLAEIVATINDSEKTIKKPAKLKLLLNSLSNQIGKNVSNCLTKWQIQS